jgi:hypothetical protein
VSAFLHHDRDGKLAFDIWDNDNLIALLELSSLSRQNDVVIEKIQSFGMPVGAEVFDTCVWIGRFIQVTPDPPAVRLVGRQEVKLHHCHSARAKDSNIRQAMIDRFGPGKDKAIGRKASPGPLHGVRKDIWSALAIACYHLDTRESPVAATG